MKTFNEDLFVNDIGMAPFHVCEVFDDVDDKLWAHNTLFKFVLETHAPLKKRTVTNKNIPHMNSTLRKAMNQRNMWRSKHFKNRRDKHARSKYVYWRNKVVSLNRSSIKTYFDSKCNSASGDAKTFFSTVSPYMSDKNF